MRFVIVKLLNFVLLDGLELLYNCRMQGVIQQHLGIGGYMHLLPVKQTFFFITLTYQRWKCNYFSVNFCLFVKLRRHVTLKIAKWNWLLTSVSLRNHTWKSHNTKMLQWNFMNSGIWGLRFVHQIFNDLWHLQHDVCWFWWVFSKIIWLIGGNEQFVWKQHRNFNNFEKVCANISIFQRAPPAQAVDS